MLKVSRQAQWWWVGQKILGVLKELNSHSRRMCRARTLYRNRTGHSCRQGMLLPAAWLNARIQWLLKSNLKREAVGRPKVVTAEQDVSLIDVDLEEWTCLMMTNAASKDCRCRNA